MKTLFSALFVFLLFPAFSHAATWVIPTSPERTAVTLSRASARYAVPAVATTNVPRVATVLGGNVARRSLGLIGPIGVACSLGITAYELYNLGKDDPANYPAFGAAIREPVGPVTLGKQQYDIGDFVTFNGSTYKVTGKIGSWEAQGCILENPKLVGGMLHIYSNPSPNPEGCGAQYQWTASSTSPGWYDGYNVQPVTSGTVSDPIPYDAFYDKLYMSQLDNSLKSGFMDDVDKAIVSNPTLATPTVTPSQLTEIYNDYSETVYNETTVNRNNSLQNIYEQKQAIADADPTNEEKQLDAEKAKSEYEEALQDDAARQKDESDKLEEEAKLPDTSPDELKSFDWSKLNELRGALASAWPFTLLAAIPSKISSLVSEPQAPVFSLPVFGNTMTVDLSLFNPVATVCRWAIGLLLSVGCVFYLVEFFRGK